MRGKPISWYVLLGMFFTASRHFPSGFTFSSAETGLYVPFSYQYLSLPIVHTIFCLSSVTKAISKGFVVLGFDTAITEDINKNNREPDR